MQVTRPLSASLGGVGLFSDNTGSQAPRPGLSCLMNRDVHLLVGSGLLEGELGTPKASHRVPTEVQRVPSSQ